MNILKLDNEVAKELLTPVPIIEFKDFTLFGAEFKWARFNKRVPKFKPIDLLPIVVWMVIMLHIMYVPIYVIAGIKKSYRLIFGDKGRR